MLRWSLTEIETVFRYIDFPKKPASNPCVQPWLVAVGTWRLAVTSGWRLVAVGGGWRRLVIGDWWLVAVDSGWQLAASPRWRVAAVSDGWWLAVAGGGWLAGVGGWRLAVFEKKHLVS